MNETPSNSAFQPQAEDQTQSNQVTTQSHYRRRNSHNKVNPNHLGGNTQTVIQSSKMDDQHHTPTNESGQEELKPRKQAEKVSNPNGIEPDSHGHKPEDQKEFDPKKEIPEEDNYLVDEEGSIIKEPTRELDDPYRPGHGSKKGMPPIKKDFSISDLKENIKTNY
ncbi:hypothetical protein [Algoriphagus boritolerans]|uniref:Uncharacterized protein n=1 Tax=Algoriphagus boritolerans DSM 17298 = JCM 18970 TaxID=1120964 RepID=A0A1H5XZX6_9BACT|nr:hypothetical protein [Algoriphagus boritolerans]SEG16836.1 hypothetical protein SAMN03080598_02727 [Algoriphagus boritolerans DSM 17298 = JCM 18970]